MGKRLSILSAAVGATAGLAGALYYALFRRPLPQTSGTLHLGGLSHDVEIIRDRWGRPHIYAQNPQDLFFAQGFVHAQDRLFQMEFSRRLGAGRLSEILGPPALEADRWLRVLGLRRVSEKEVPLLEPETRELMLAYANGVNAFIDRGKLPMEFSLLRHQPERWQIADSLTWAKFMDWSLSVNWESELTRAQLIARLGPEGAADLDGPYPGTSPTTLPPGIDGRYIGSDALTRADAARPYTGPPTEAGLGSNNWAVNGSRTASGAPLLASDMHLPLKMPSIWYENHLCGGDYDVVGLSFPGLPGVMAGHNGQVAWSFTAGFPDTQDLYVERLNPENPHQYEFEGNWHDAKVLYEEIVVKGGDPVMEKVIITHHGPLIDGLVPDEVSEPVALRWTALEPSDMVNLLFDMVRARTCQELHNSLRRWAGPPVNVVYADVQGNIGYTLAGRMPVRATDAGHDGRTPVPGWTGEYEWRGYIPFKDWPHVINPPEEMLITANARPVSDDYPYDLGQAWMPGFRAARIAELLKDQRQLTVADFCRMQSDQQSVLARRVGQFLSQIEPRIPDLEVSIFKDWDGDLSPDSSAAAVYQVFVRRMLYNLFDTAVADSSTVKDESSLSPDALADRFVGRGPHPVLERNSVVFGSNGRALLLHLLDEPERFADSSLFQERSLEDIALQSLREAIDFLKWELGPQTQKWHWGDLHQLTLSHPLGQVKPLDKLLNRGPYPIGGDETTIWATGAHYHDLSHDYLVGPVCRFVVDLGTLSRSRSLNTPGQSGQPGSPHYADHIQAWLQGAHYPLLYRRPDVIAHAKHTLHLLA